MNYGLWSIVIICATALGIGAQIVCLIITRRRAEQLGVLRVKYPIWNGGTAFSAFVAILGIFMIIICIVEIPRNLADIADYQTRLSQDTEFYDQLITKAENALAKDRYSLVWSIAVVMIELLSIFMRGAYITKDGVMFFGGLKPQKTSARIEFGAINFYTGEKRQRYAFELPENEDNKEQFGSLITTAETAENTE